MKIFKLITIIISVIFLSTKAIALNDNEITNNFMLDKISKNLRCLICQGQSVYDSQSDFALSIKLLIQRKLSEGKTEIEISNIVGDTEITDDSKLKHCIIIISTNITL